MRFVRKGDIDPDRAELIVRLMPSVRISKDGNQTIIFRPRRYKGQVALHNRQCTQGVVRCVSDHFLANNVIEPTSYNGSLK